MSPFDLAVAVGLGLAAALAFELLYLLLRRLGRPPRLRLMLKNVFSPRPSARKTNAMRRALRSASLLVVLGAALGCASSGPKVADPACREHGIEIPADVEPGAPLSRPQPPPPRGGPSRGYACVAVTLTADGRIADPELLATNHDGFARSFLAVLPRWRYEPATRAGEPVEVRILLSASYRRSSGAGNREPGGS